MKLLWFLLGFSSGIALLLVQRSRYERKLKSLLRGLNAEANISAFSYNAQLASAIAHQQSERQQLEYELQDYKQILNSAPLGYLQVDDENRLLWGNPKAYELLCIQQEYYRQPRLLLELVRSYELDELVEQTRIAGKPRQLEWTFRPASDDPTNLSQQQGTALRGYAFPLRNSHVGIFLENCQEEENLKQQRDRWASDVAHELKTPLTSIRLVAETVQSRLDPSLRSWMERLINEAIRLSNLVQDLLDLSQIDRGSHHSLQLKTTDLVELIQSAWLNLEPLARKKYLHLDYCGPERLLMQIDQPRMYRVMLNLLDNSIKYSPPRQRIRVQVSVEPTSNLLEPDGARQYMHLEVIDAGVGFPDHALPYVFERFYRVDPARSRNVVEDSLPESIQSKVVNAVDLQPDRDYGQSDLRHRSSSGLGLAIVRQIVEAHHGSVSASNHPETGGAWLQVRLPLQPPELPFKS